MVRSPQFSWLVCGGGDERGRGSRPRREAGGRCAAVRDSARAPCGARRRRGSWAPAAGEAVPRCSSHPSVHHSLCVSGVCACRCCAVLQRRGGLCRAVSAPCGMRLQVSPRPAGLCDPAVVAPRLLRPRSRRRRVTPHPPRTRTAPWMLGGRCAPCAGDCAAVASPVQCMCRLRGPTADPPRALHTGAQRPPSTHSAPQAGHHSSLLAALRQPHTGMGTRPLAASDQQLVAARSPRLC